MQTILEEAKVSLALFPGWSGGSSGAEVTIWQVLKVSLGLACSFCPPECKPLEKIKEQNVRRGLVPG